MTDGVEPATGNGGGEPSGGTPLGVGQDQSNSVVSPGKLGTVCLQGG